MRNKHAREGECLDEMEDDTHSNNNDFSSGGGKTPLEEEEVSVRDLLSMKHSNSFNPFTAGKTKTQNQILPKHMLPYSEPIEVSHFSKTKSGETFFDSRNLKRTRDPQLPFDLNEGFANFRDRDRLDKYPAPLLPLFESLERSGKASLLLDVDVLSWRGNMSKLLCAPWESREGFRLECELVRRKFDRPDDDDGKDEEDDEDDGDEDKEEDIGGSANKKLKRTSSTNTNNSTNDATTNSSGGGGGSPGDTVTTDVAGGGEGEGGIQDEAIRNISNNSNAKSKRPATLVLNVLEAEHKLEEAREMLKNKKDPAGKQTKSEKDLAWHERMSYWGFAFEEFVTSEKPHANAVNCRESFCTVTKSKLGENTKLLLGGEVDCWNGIAEGLSGYVELKTSRKIDTKKQRANFEKFKLLKWWAQSFTVGVRQILVGFRDDDGMVQKMQNLETMKLPSYALAADKKNAWRPEVALTFAEKVLTFIRETMEKYPENSRALVEFIPARTKGESKFKITVVEDIPDFLPKLAREMLQMSARDLLSRDEEKRKKILASQAPPTISFSGQESENSAGGSIDQSHHHASRPRDSSSPDFAAEIAKSGSGGSGGSHRFKNASQLALNRKRPMVSRDRREKLKREREKARALNNARENQLGWIGGSAGAPGGLAGVGDFANANIRRSYAFGATSYLEELGKNALYYATGGGGILPGTSGEQQQQHQQQLHHQQQQSNENLTASGQHVGIGIDPSAVLKRLLKSNGSIKNDENDDDDDGVSKNDHQV